MSHLKSYKTISACIMARQNQSFLAFIFFIAPVFTMFFLDSPCIAAPSYTWQAEYNISDTIENRIFPPTGYKRTKIIDGSFSKWLRGLPLKPGHPPVYLYNGAKKGNQYAHFAVMDINVGKKNLQQCADAVMRLRGEFLFSQQNWPAIHFNFTSGDRANFTRWAEGFRPVIKKNKVRWKKKGSKGKTYKNFMAYLDTVFMYAGSYSLSRELKPVKKINQMKIGDVFIKGGFPGHAVIVVDMAESVVPSTLNKKIFLLAQSYMPAQQIHILKNPSDPRLSPWYSIDFGSRLYTPEWVFEKNQLKRFK